MNELIFIIQTFFLTAVTILSLRLGAEALIALVALYGVLANLFVTKQIVLFGLTVTPSDAFTIGGIVGLNLVQEYFGSTLAKRTIWISFGSIIIYTLASQLHLWYLPASCDTAHAHFCAILEAMPRITLASCFVYVLIQYIDRWLYAKLQKDRVPFLIRNYASLVICQFIDTVLFSFLGLYGIVDNIWDIILVSYLVKLIAITLSTPLLVFIKKPL